MIDADEVERLARPAEMQGHRHAIAGLALGDAGADGDDRADGIDAEDMRQLHRPRILAGADDAIEGAVDRNGGDLDHNLARTGLGCRHFLELHHLGAAEFADNVGFNVFLPIFAGRLESASHRHKPRRPARL
jgi:hypothetical protein